LYDLQSARLLESIDAHTAAIWSIQLYPDGTGFVTGSADKRLKFWSFDVVSESAPKESSLAAPKRLTVAHSKTFELTDDALACKFSKNGKYLAVALLDSTVKVYAVDSMKLFHTLYGHKLPVMSLDISDDNTIIVTGSADKNIRIWGMDFGDCHKSIFAHADSVMGLAFVPQTHYFFSVGKDGVLKYWDADKFEHVLSLEGHQAETWALAVSTDGDFVITGSHDRSLRIWERTEDQVVVSDERETEMEQSWEATMEAEDKYATEEKAESAKATKQTMETIKAGEKLIDALELLQTEEENWKVYEADVEKARKMGVKNPEASVPKPPSNELMMGKGPSDYLLHIVKSIRSSDLDEAMLLLPLGLVLKFILHLDSWIKQDIHLELCARCLFFLLRVYQSQISANKSIQSTLHSMRDNIRSHLSRHRDIIGFNQVALNHIKRTMELDSNVKFFEAREEAFKQNGAKRQKVGRKNYWE
jgi:U3 small nucleolar RNA-associated protein 12